MKKTFIFLTAGIIVTASTIGGITYFTKTNSVTNSDYSSVANVTELSSNTESRVSDIDWTKYEIKTVTLNNETLEITSEGVYQISGTISNGMIKINTSGNVKLILDGVTITNSSGPAIYVENADNVEISTNKGTTNTLQDANTYTGFDTDVNGCIYSTADLILSGSGTLKVTSNYEDAIVSKDDLKITGGTYIIKSKDDGIRGKDSIEITDGTFTIDAKGDAIKATNDTDTGKGFILISGGNFDLTSTNDAIQAETDLSITGGTFKITTGGGSSNASTSSSWGMWGNTNSTTTESAKGIKANGNIIISDATFDLNTSDDAIHSNNYVGIKSGAITINSGDDGIHADSSLIIDGGTITINKSFEGLEASEITINDGNIKITASDDGINVAGGNDASSMNRPGANSFNASTNKLTINGGSVYVNASGDGLDANGSIYINGGTTMVDGPTDNGNGALDYDGELKVTGGSIITAGSSGMAQGISNSSTAYGVLINFTNSYTKGTKVTITDESGNEVASVTPAKTFSSVLVSNSKLKGNTTYKVLVDNKEYTTFTTTSTSVMVGTTGGMGGNMAQGGMMRNNADTNTPEGNAPDGNMPQNGMGQNRSNRGGMRKQN